MKRREFSNSLLAASLFAPPVLGPTSALANENEREREEIEAFARLALRTGAGLVLVTWMLILFPTLLGLDFRRTIPRYVIARMVLGGLLGGLNRPTLNQRFKGAAILGTVYLLGTLLMILPFVLRQRSISRTLVASDDFEYEHPGKPGGVKIEGVPSRRELAGMTRIGSAYLNAKGELVVVADDAADDLDFLWPKRKIDAQVRLIR